MLRLYKAGILALVFALSANVAAAQSPDQVPRRDSLWNGTLIGLGAGVGSVAALDAVFCENGFGGCDFPWAAVLTLGGIGAAAGAGIDFLIRRDPDGGNVTLRLTPMIGGARKGVLASVVLPRRRPPPAPSTHLMRERSRLAVGQGDGPGTEPRSERGETASEQPASGAQSSS
jgi:hypothetical protein